MSPKPLSVSSTSASMSNLDWRQADALVPGKGASTTSTETDLPIVVATERRLASSISAAAINVSIAPASASRRQAIRRLNEELEGRSLPSDTYASKTAR
jgi:hypothetical protein